MPKGKKSVDMTQGPILKHLIVFAMPLLIGQIFQQLYNTVDSVVVGQFVGKQALAAVGSTGSVINALIGFFSGLSMGAGVVISQCFGARDKRGVHNAVHTAMALTIGAALFCTVLGLVATDPLLRMMSTPEDVFAEASAYLRIYFGGIVGLMVYNIGAGILRAVGDSKRPLYFLIFSACLNVVLDLVFVIFFRMGVAGVAWATVVSQCASAVLILIVLAKTKEDHQLQLSRLHIHGGELKRILRIGLPAGIQTSVVSFSNVFVQAYINEFQSDCMAGWTSYSRLDAFAWLLMMCVGMANTTFVGQNLGAGRIDRVKKGVNAGLILSAVGTAVIVAVLMLFSDTALKLFNSDPNVLEYGRMFVLWLSPFYIPYCAMLIYSGALRGAGDSLSPMIITIGSFVVFRQLYLIIGTQFITSPLFVGMSYPAGWVVASIATTLVYRSGRWEKNLKAKQAAA
ncbi:MAG: MATE family efflux transporter [Clostridia bacterium]|nr:MATE family efflux transporter [Clostridia bacterium]